MYVVPIAHSTIYSPAVLTPTVGTNGGRDLTPSPVRNGNPGIVPPWLQDSPKLSVIGVDPVCPDVPSIM